MAKVSIVKLSQKLIFVDGTSFFGPTSDFEMALKTAILKIFGYARNGSRDRFGNGMTRGTTWEGLEYLVVTKVKIRIALICQALMFFNTLY